MRRVIVWGTLLYTLALLSLALLWRLGVDIWWVALPSIVQLFWLDYVWARGLEPLSAFRNCRTGSDHCLVVADVRLP